jgi:hypothetical protein
VGRNPSKYTKQVVSRLLGAIANGLTLKQACVVAGIAQNTLALWRQEHPELVDKIAKAKEIARQKALKAIKAAGENGDWRAWAEWLRFSYPEDYRRKPEPQQQKHLHVHGDTGITLSIERQEEIREQIRRIKATTTPEPANERRIQPAGLLVRPEERERSEAEAQPVQEAEVIEQQPVEQQHSAGQNDEQMAAARAIWNTYQRNGDEQEAVR